MTAKLTKIALSIVIGMLGLVLVMVALAGAGPVAALDEVAQNGGGALIADVPTDVLVDASPEEIRADGSSTSTITARIYDGGTPVQGAFAAFTTTLGTIDQFCYVEAEDASVNKSAGDWVTESFSGASGGQYVRTCGTAHPIASLSWTFTASAISMLYVKDHNGGVAEVQVDGGTAITVDTYAGTTTAAERVITAGLGSGAHVVTVKYLDQSPVGGGTCIRIDAFRCGTTTDADGKGTTTLTSAMLSCGSEDATVTALTGDPSISYMITGTESVRFTASVPDSMAFTATPDQIVADGASISTLEAVVKDQFDEYVPDYTMVGFVVTDENSAAPGEPWVILPYELVEAEDPSEVITDGWTIDSYASYHDGQAIYTNTTGATATWAFTGTAVSMVYARLADAGVATVAVDGGSPITIDMYASSPQYQVEHVITDTLSFGAHSIVVTVGGYTVTGGTDTRVYLDAFRSGTGTSGGTATDGLTSGTQTGVTWVEATAVGVQCCETDNVVTETIPITLTAGNPYTLTITPTDIDTTCCVTSTLQFTVTDQYSNVIGAVVPRTLTVDFTSTPYGDFSLSSVEITNGIGSVEFHGYESGSGAITGTVQGYGVVGTAVLTVAPASCDTLDISADRAWIYVTDTTTSLLTDFVYTTTITAELGDSCSNTVQDGTEVTFTTSLGSLSPANPITTVNGIATAVLTSEQLPVGVPTQTAYITVTGAGCPVSDTISVDFGRHVYTLTVTADPDEMRVGGNLSDLTADVDDGFGNSTPDGVTVAFTITPSSMASVPPAGVATSGGTATAVATSGTQAGVATIEAAATGTMVTNTALITITAGDPYTLTMTPTDIDTACCVTSTLQFTVTDQYSNVLGAVDHRSTTVCFYSIPDNLVDTWSPGSCVVVTSGVGSAEFHGWASESGTIAGYVQGFAYVQDTSNITVSFGAPATLSVSRDPTAILADGLDTTTITATVRDSCENLVAGSIVTFTTDLGSFGPPPTTTLSITVATDASGVATATMRSECTARTVNITVTVGSTIETTDVDMVGVAWDMQLAANPTTIQVGGYISELTATVKDQFGYTVLDGTVVTFTTSLGNVGSDTVAKTTTSGVATAVLTSSNSPGTAIITATSGIAVDATAVTFEAGPPYTVTLEAYPTTLTVGNTSALTATVKDQYNNHVADGTVVTFTTDLGDVGSQLVTKTTTTGVATAELASQVAGTATVTATAGAEHDTALVTFQPDLPYTLTLAADPTNLTVGESSTLTATVTDQYSNAVANGTVVHFETNLGSVGSSTVDKPTAEGIAIATLTSLLPGTAAITATADPASDTASVTFEAGPPYTVTLEAYPISIPVAGSTSTLTATVVDLYNNNVDDGTVVTFTTSLGSLGTDPVVKTTTNGIATAVLTSETTIGTAVITATADSKFDTAAVEFTPLLPYTVTLVAYPLNLTVGETSALTATVVDQYANNVADGTSVLFETNLGSLGSLSVTKTTTDGIALATLTSQVPGTATVAATADAASDTVDVHFEVGPPYTVTLEANPTSILVGGFTSALTVTVVDQFSNDVADGTVVHFETSLGSLEGSATIDKDTASGVATATLTSGDVAGVAMITATAGSEVATTVVTFTPDIPDVITLAADPTSLTVGETSMLTSTVKDQYNNNVDDGTVVTFTTSLGDVGSQLVVKTTTSGVATADLTSLLPGVAMLTATADSKVATTTVEFQPGLPYTVTLVAQPISLTVGETSVLTATVVDQYNNNVADGTVVNFETNLGSVGSNTIDKPAVNGVATATLTSQVSGTAAVTATSGSEHDTANVTFNPGPPDTMTVEADPTSIPIGGFTSDVTATVRDQYGNLVADGTEVTFVTDLGSIGSNSVIKTTVNGVANATLTSGLVIGTADITVTSGSAEGETQVIFTVGAPETVVAESWPPTIEVGGNTATITATVRDIGGYMVADGTPVVFTTDFASLGSSTVTKYTTDGVAVATLTSELTPGVAHITAESNSKSDTAIVKVAAGPPFDIQVTADPAYIPIGGATSRITAMVKDRYGNNVVNGTNVDFITTLGSIWPSSDATIEGAAVVTLTSGIIKGPATITAISGPEEGAVDVIFTVGPPFFINVEADPSTIGLNGETSDIQATVKDMGGNNVADGTEVTFSTSLGVLGSTMVIKTTINGVAMAVLTSETTAGTAIITATADSHSHTTQVVINPDPPNDVAVTADPMLIPADGVSTAAIRTLVTDQYDNPVADGTNCSFETTLGSVWPLFDTTLNGVAETTLTVGEDAGLAVVKAICAGLEDTILVSFYEPRFKVYLPLVFKRY